MQPSTESSVDVNIFAFVFGAVSSATFRKFVDPQAVGQTPALMSKYLRGAPLQAACPVNIPLLLV